MTKKMERYSVLWVKIIGFFDFGKISYFSCDYRKVFYLRIFFSLIVFFFHSLRKAQCIVVQWFLFIISFCIYFVIKMLTAEYYTSYYRLDDFDLKMISLGGEENEMSFSRSLKSFFFLLIWRSSSINASILSKIIFCFILLDCILSRDEVMALDSYISRDSVSLWIT